MLAVPYLTGLVAVGFRWPDLPLLIGWLAGYLLSYYVLLGFKSRRPARYREPITLYAAVTVPMVLLTVLAAPGVLAWAPLYAGLFAVNAWHAYRRRERAFLNDLAAVVQSCSIVFVTATVAGRPAADALGVFLLCLGYFTGTVFYVKTMIRERGNVRFRRWSVAYHLVACAVAWWASPVAGLFFTVLLARAAVLPHRSLTPRQVGSGELALCVLVVPVAGLL
jgi:hypothetical protein